jgi:hypothetical protein
MVETYLFERFGVRPYAVTSFTFVQRDLVDLKISQRHGAPRTRAPIAGIGNINRNGFGATVPAKPAAKEHKPETVWTSNRLQTCMAKLALHAVARNTGTAIWTI